MANRQFNSVDGYTVGNADNLISIVTSDGAITATNLSANGNVAFSGSNVSLGNVTSVRITGGSSGQYLQTDGTGNLSWSSVTSGSTSNISNGTSNVSITTADGNITLSVGGSANVAVITTTGAVINGNLTTTGTILGTLGTASQPNITSVGTLTSLTVTGNVATGNISAVGIANVGSLKVNGISNLGPVSNISITGGISGQFLRTDGAGNISWANAGAKISSTPPVSPNVGDLWWDSDIGVLFVYYYDGVSYQWVESSPEYLSEGPTGTYTLGGNLIVTNDLTVQGTLYETSDVNLKEKIETISSPVETVNKLRGVNFEWASNKQQSMGMIAQEVEEILPHLVHQQDDGTKVLHYTAIIGLLIEAVKELSEKINAN